MGRGCLSSFAGFLIGPLLLIGAVVLLSWNEGREVHALAGLGQASQAVVEASATAVSPSNEGKLAHVVGTATATSPITDPDVKASFDGQLAVSRQVEMYQWRETQDSNDHTRYDYAGAWSATPADSASFHAPQGHANPPMPFGAMLWGARDARLGAFALDDEALKRLDLAPLTPSAPDGWSANGGYLYNADPAAPKIGDLRVTYRGLPSGVTLSALAAQSHGGFAAYTAPNGYQIELVVAGNQTAPTMLGQQQGAEQGLTWGLRVAGFFGMFFGLALFLGPLSNIVAAAPVLGSIAQRASVLAALVITAPATLIVCAISWLAFRPLIGGGLMLAAALVFFGLYGLHRVTRPAPATVR